MNINSWIVPLGLAIFVPFSGCMSVGDSSPTTPEDVWPWGADIGQYNVSIHQEMTINRVRDGQMSLEEDAGNCIWISGAYWIKSGVINLSWDSGLAAETLELLIIDFRNGQGEVLHRVSGPSTLTLRFDSMPQPQSWPNASKTSGSETEIWITTPEEDIVTRQPVTLVADLQYLAKDGDLDEHFRVRSCSGNP